MKAALFALALLAGTAAAAQPAIAAAAAQPAAGGWQGARWGMTREQVRAAATIPVTEAPLIPGSSSPSLTGAYTASGFHFTVLLHFDLSGHLIGAMLDVKDGVGCFAVEHVLGERYGLPYREDLREEYVDRAWRDEAGGNIVSFVSSSWPQNDSGRSCYIAYSPLVREDSGL